MKATARDTQCRRCSERWPCGRRGQPVRAALSAAGAGSTCASKLYRETFLDDGGGLFSVVWVPAGAARPTPKAHRARNLKRLVIEEVAR
jgi:hypothetical protein